MRLRSSLAALATVALVLGGLALAAPASAAILPLVDTLSDDTADGYTLRDAVTEANTLSAGPDAIGFAPGLSGVIELTAVLLVSESLTITGPGSSVLAIRRAPATPTTDYFQFSPAADDQDFTLSGLTIDGDGAAVGFGLHAVATSGHIGRNITLNDLTMTDLVGASTSGGVQIEGLTGTLLIEDSTFRSITSPPGPNGAALNVREVATVTIEDTAYDQNSAGGGGGALSVTDVRTFTFLRGSLTTNSTAGAGGAGIIDSVDLFVLRDTVVRGNDVTGGGVGGGFYFGGVREVRISGTTLDDNDATDEGGSLYFAQNPAVVTISDSTFSSSDALGVYGGAIQFASESAQVTITRCRFTNNSSASSGGAIHIATVAGAARIEDSTFTGNAAVYGGGLHADQVLAGGSVTVAGSTFFANLGRFYGAAVYLADVRGSFDVVDSTFDERTATAAFAIVTGTTHPGATVTLRHSTILGFGGYGVSFSNGSSSVTHSIVQSTLLGSAIFLAVGNPVDVSWSLLSEAPSAGMATLGAGVQTSGDPQLGPLQLNGGITPTFLPAASSPVVGAGDPAVTGQPTFDQRGAGYARVNGIIDIGAVERAAELPPTGSEQSGGLGLIALLLVAAGAFAMAGSRRTATAATRRAIRPAP